jgi:ankyrin repeat protein
MIKIKLLFNTIRNLSFSYICLQSSRLLNECDKNGDLPLLLALSSKQKTVASTLVEHGASVDAKDPKGLNLLLVSVDRGRARFFSSALMLNLFTYSLDDWYSATFLLDQKASPSCTTPDLGDTALHMIANKSTAFNPFEDEQDEEDDSQSEMKKVAQKLLDCGLNPNLQNSKG